MCMKTDGTLQRPRETTVADFLFTVECAFLRHPKTEEWLADECERELIAMGMGHLIAEEHGP